MKNYEKNKNVNNSAVAESLTFIHPKKSLGQNFLKSTLAINKIIEAGEIKNTDVILEIGPGKGALTEKLLERAGRVIAVEKDWDLIKILQEKFKEEIKEKKLILVNEDILEYNPLLASPLSGGGKKYKIIANIPYNITGAIFKKFLTANPPAGGQPELMVLMVQHEVAKRIMGRKTDISHGVYMQKSRNGKESILSISVKAYGEPKIIMKVPARYFSPAPRVDSAVIAVRNISRDRFTSPHASHFPSPKLLFWRGARGEGIPPRLSATPQEGNKVNEAKFWQIIHAGFAHKRKVLIKNLKDTPPQSSPKGRKEWIEIFKELNLSEKIRAEDLTLADWIYITSRI